MGCVFLVLSALSLTYRNESMKSCGQMPAGSQVNVRRHPENSSAQDVDLWLLFIFLEIRANGSISVPFHLAD